MARSLTPSAGGGEGAPAPPCWKGRLAASWRRPLSASLSVATRRRPRARLRPLRLGASRPCLAPRRVSSPPRGVRGGGAAVGREAPRRKAGTVPSFPAASPARVRRRDGVRVGAAPLPPSPGAAAGGAGGRGPGAHGRDGRDPGNRQALLGKAVSRAYPSWSPTPSSSTPGGWIAFAAAAVLGNRSREAGR